MPLISRHPNAILKFCPIGKQLVQFGVRFGNPKFDIVNIIYVLNQLALTLHYSIDSFLSPFQIIWSHLVLLLSYKAFVLTIKVTFKRIDTKLTLLALKILWYGILMLSRELTNSVFTSHTNSHWHRTLTIPAARVGSRQ